MEQNIDTKLWERAEQLAARSYEVSVFTDTLTNGDLVHIVTNPELPGCKADGATQEEAEAKLREVRKDFIYFLLVDNLPVPPPRVQLSGTQSTVSTTTVTVTLTPSTKSSTAELERLIEPDSSEKKLSYFNVPANP